MAKLPRDVAEFLEFYPRQSQNDPSTANLEFYLNKRVCQPDGLLIEELHDKWFRNYSVLEAKHGFIQWIFPVREHGVNYEAVPLTYNEIEKMKNSTEIQARMRKSIDLMLDFYGMEVKSSDPIVIGRCVNYKSQYENLSRSSHNYLRISRILKSISEMNLEPYAVPWLMWFLVEQSRNQLNSRTLVNSMDTYWIHCIRDENSRAFMNAITRKVRKGHEVTEKDYKVICTSYGKLGKWTLPDSVEADDAEEKL